MPYTHCSACGAKALVGATRCPRCQAPFVSYDPKGDRVETVTCPKCGVQRPVAIGVCPNCLTSTAPSGWRLTRGLIFTGVGIGLIVAVGYAISRRTERTRPANAPAVSSVSVASADSAISPDTGAVVAHDSVSKSPIIPAANVESMAATTPSPTKPAPAPSATPGASQKIATSPTPTAPSQANPVRAPAPAPPPSVAVPDTGVWEYAVARTWVRVRSAPSIASDVLRMVDSAQRVRLGPPVNGWRSVRVGVDRGWVDPRLFTVTPAAKP